MRITDDREDEFDRYDFAYPEDASERDLVEKDEQFERDQERRDMQWWDYDH